LFSLNKILNYKYNIRSLKSSKAAILVKAI
jgi:hypothetical protein